MKLLQSVTGTFLLSTLVTAAPTVSPRAAPQAKTVYQFPTPGTWMENIFSTRNGSVLSGRIFPAELYLIDPNSPTNAQTTRLVNAFPASVGNSVFGIAEPTQDLFAVLVGNTSETGAGASPGSFSVWNVDFRSGKAKVSKIAALPNAVFPNGMTSVNSRTLLIADSTAGNVIALNTETKVAKVVIDDASMKFGADAFVPLGINGIKIGGKSKNTLYYTNTYSNSLHRVQVNTDTGAAVSAFTTIATGLIGPDDLAVTDAGVAYVAENFGNSIARVSSAGVVERVVGGITSSVVAGPTSVTLGRGSKDSGSAFVSTNGARNSPVNGTFTEPGKIVVFQL